MNIEKEEDKKFTQGEAYNTLETHKMIGYSYIYNIFKNEDFDLFIKERSMLLLIDLSGNYIILSFLEILVKQDHINLEMKLQKLIKLPNKEKNMESIELDIRKEMVLLYKKELNIKIDRILMTKSLENYLDIEKVFTGESLENRLILIKNFQDKLKLGSKIKEKIINNCKVVPFTRGSYSRLEDQITISMKNGERYIDKIIIKPGKIIQKNTIEEYIKKIEMPNSEGLIVRITIGEKSKELIIDYPFLYYGDSIKIYLDFKNIKFLTLDGKLLKKKSMEVEV